MRLQPALVLLVFAFGVSASEAHSAGVPASSTPGGVIESATRTWTVPVEGGGYTNVDASGLASMLPSKDFLLINVHIPYEGEIDKTDLFIPYDQIENRVRELPTEKGAKIVLYCRSGRMSDLAARVLVRLGYTNVWHLDGGMDGWKQAGFPLRGDFSSPGHDPAAGGRALS